MHLWNIRAAVLVFAVQGVFANAVPDVEQDINKRDVTSTKTVTKTSTVHDSTKTVTGIPVYLPRTTMTLPQKVITNSGKAITLPASLVTLHGSTLVAAASNQLVLPDNTLQAGGQTFTLSGSLITIGGTYVVVAARTIPIPGGITTVKTTQMQTRTETVTLGGDSSVSAAEILEPTVTKTATTVCATKTISTTSVRIVNGAVTTVRITTTLRLTSTQTITLGNTTIRVAVTEFGYPVTLPDSTVTLDSMTIAAGTSTVTLPNSIVTFMDTMIRGLGSTLSLPHPTILADSSTFSFRGLVTFLEMNKLKAKGTDLTLPGAPITITSTVGQSTTTITFGGSTLTLPDNVIYAAESTITLPASTITMSGSVVRASASVLTLNNAVISAAGFAWTLPDSIVTISGTSPRITASKTTVILPGYTSILPGLISTTTFTQGGTLIRQVHTVTDTVSETFTASTKITKIDTLWATAVIYTTTTDTVTATSTQMAEFTIRVTETKDQSTLVQLQTVDRTLEPVTVISTFTPDPVTETVTATQTDTFTTPLTETVTATQTQTDTFTPSPVTETVTATETKTFTPDPLTNTVTETATFTPDPVTVTATETTTLEATLQARPATNCNNTGWQLAMYNNTYLNSQHSNSFSAFVPEDYKTRQPVANTTTDRVGLTYAESAGLDFYGFTPPDLQIILNYRGYFYAPNSTYYNFHVYAADDFAEFWVGTVAYSGWVRSNGFISQYIPGSGGSSTQASTTLYLSAGTYIPLRIIYGNGGCCGARFSFDVYDNDNNYYAQYNTSSPYLVANSCASGFAPPYAQPFGQET
ncbi:hypothetical protein H072_7215 [Dactylellina haptotyla CBS 200.50]|uniref:PA14 domain-containing protein n=1 Tax=Dactylellina haptotyla (strain CBS 200.50) TaxID=1284197 RepID=S8BI85_DACHA|nr:hypothetical protein H072_7215 [Dactylellina haptotyla CBS 200.50]